MNKFEIEVVRFDAEDVIATSGPAVGSYLFTRGATAKDYNVAYGGFDFGQTTGQQIVSNTKYFVYNPADATKTSGYIKALSSNEGKVKDDWKTSYPNYFIAENTDQILAWILVNNGQ